MKRDRSRSPLNRSDDRRRGGGHENRGGRFDPHSDKMAYISNLPYELNWMELKDVIRDKGGEVSFVEILKNKDGKSKGVAVVEFVSKDSAQKSIEILHREPINGRNISVKEIRDPQAFFRKVKEDTGVDFLRERRGGGGGGGSGGDRSFTRDRRSSPVGRASGETYGLSSSFLDSLGLKPPLVNRVFITNISYTCGVGKLYDVFAMAGKITWIDLQLDKDGKTKGMAIVEYSHPIEAVQAVSMLHNQRLFDRTITVKMDRFEKDQDRNSSGIPNGLRGVGMGLGANGSPLSDIASVIGQMGQAQQQPQQTINAFQNPGLISANTNISQPIQPQAFPFSQQQQPSVQSAFETNPYNNSSLPNQSFASTASARQVSPAPNSFFGQPSPFGNNQRQDGFFERKTGSAQSTFSAAQTPSRSTQSSFVSSYDVPTRLPYDYTWDVIAQRVRQFGDFESVELVSSGVAKVRFLHVQDAERAKATLNNTVVENNMIAVEYILQ